MRRLLWICIAAPLGVVLCLLLRLVLALYDRNETLNEMCERYIRDVLS